MQVTEQFLRCGLQQGKFQEIGTAVKQTNSSRYTYYINRAKFNKYIGRG